MEVKSFEAYQGMGQDPKKAKQMEEIMKGYHDLIDFGRREIYTIEG